jgi:hypothetical protein
MTKLRLWVRMVCGAAVVLAFAQTAPAQDGKWINLFDGETLYGWNDLGDAAWAVEDGSLVCDSGTGGLLATTSRFKDFELTLDIKVKPEYSAGIVVRGDLAGHHTENGSTVLTIDEPKSGSGEWKSVRIVARGDSVSAEVDGDAVELTGGGNELGYIGFQFHTFHNKTANEVAVKDVKLRPIALTPIFNGENLDGWNIIPDRQSKFNVENNAIRVTDGNGQIETDGEYKDFVLQIDVYSNGEHLNSGVFWRSPKGEFWRGYEAQVRNQWQGDDRAKPVDFGTGGNYGNVPARKVVSSDGEWFTKTIIVDGNHAAVWVNGYLASDYTDTRPVANGANGKVGYVPGPGTITLQGHDPATDLSFANILIQEY